MSNIFTIIICDERYEKLLDELPMIISTTCNAGGNESDAPYFRELMADNLNDVLDFYESTKDNRPKSKGELRKCMMDTMVRVKYEKITAL